MLLNNKIRGVLLKCIDVLKDVISSSSQERKEIVDENLDAVKQLIVSIEKTEFQMDINSKNIEQKELDNQISVSDKSDRFATVDLESIDFLFNKAGLVSSQVNVLKNMAKLSLENAQSIENVDKSVSYTHLTLPTIQPV